MFFSNFRYYFFKKNARINEKYIFLGEFDYTYGKTIVN